ncbi:MAG: hypothetical protein CVU36_12900 [Betaproteobacteria bacterium HGW-Betaproteobacteria-9]|jgi:hypothetical protein|nr:MAG: hypothetical protein CVU36_12900 [Betaproteobacteria bacterium HGW-Betaproteobacteria-9]
MNRSPEYQLIGIVFLLVISASAGAIATLVLLREGWSLGVGVLCLIAVLSLWGAVSSSSAVRRYITNLFSG